jgi:hypothetical protein
MSSWSEPWKNPEPIPDDDYDPNDPRLLINILKKKAGDPDLQDWFLDHDLKEPPPED